MVEYNAWMNRKVYESCASLGDPERKRDRGAFFNSIHGTLNHLVWADRAFVARLFDQPLPGGTPSDIVFESFDELREERERIDAVLLSWLRR